MTKVSDICFRRKLSWFYNTLRKELRYHSDLSERFDIIRSNRFCLGYSYMCSWCGSTSIYCREDYISEFGVWMPVHIICLNCWNVYRAGFYTPTCYRLFEDWDLCAEIKWIWHGEDYALRHV